jgi:hypothetical protein
VVCGFSPQQSINISGGDYALVDPTSESEEIVFTQTSSFIGSEWKVTYSQSETQIAHLKSQGKIGTFLRRSDQFRWILSGTYVIRDSDENIVGEVSTERFSSKYTIQLQEEAPVRNALILSPLLIHTFEKEW